MYAHDWVDISNWWIGAAGLVLTVGALWQAAGAKAAAIEARKAVHRRNSVDDLARLRALVLEFSTALRNEQDDVALHLAETFISSCSVMRERHREFLKKDGAKLELTLDLVTSISLKLQQRVERQILIEDTKRVVRIISSVSGALDRRNEEVQP